MRLTKLDGALNRARDDRREATRFFRDNMYVDSELGRACLSAFLILDELRKDSKRSGAQKEAVFRSVMAAYELAEATVQQTFHVVEAFEELEQDRVELLS